MIGSRFIRGVSKTNNNNNNNDLLRLFDVKVYPKESHRFLVKQGQRQQWTNNKISHTSLHKFSPSTIPSRSCSTTSAPSLSQIGFLSWYLGHLKSRPIITKSITSSFIFSASDFTSQMITSPPSASYDSMRTSRMAAYGLLILGFAQHTWFTLISKALPKRDMLTTLKKLVMGQGIYGPCMTTVFFSYNAALQGESGGEIVARLKRDLLPTLRNGFCYWPICDFVIFKFVPVQLQPLAHNSCAYVWTIYLSYMASLKRASSE